MLSRKHGLIALTALAALLLLGSLLAQKHLAPDSGLVSSSPVVPPASVVQRSDVPGVTGQAAKDPVYDETLARVYAHFDRSEWQEAEALLQTMLKQNPDDLVIKGQLVTLYHTGLPNYDKALRLEEDILRRETTNTREFDRYRTLAKLAGKQKEALAFLSELEPASPSLAFIIPATQGAIYDELRDYPKSAEKYREALAIPEAKREILGEAYATALMKAGRYNEAEDALESALLDMASWNEAHVDNPIAQVSTLRARQKLAEVFLNNGAYQKALDLTLELQKTDSGNPRLDAIKSMAEMGLRQGKS